MRLVTLRLRDCSILLVLLTILPSAFGLLQNGSPRADAIFVHGNIYTGVASTGSGSIQREEAIAVRGDRILAVGKTDDITMLTCIWPMPA
jgi:hypothetical protein